jgi:hypothetical protein
MPVVDPKCTFFMISFIFVIISNLDKLNFVGNTIIYYSGWPMSDNCQPITIFTSSHNRESFSTCQKTSPYWFLTSKKYFFSHCQILPLEWQESFLTTFVNFINYAFVIWVHRPIKLPNYVVFTMKGNNLSLNLLVSILTIKI